MYNIIGKKVEHELWGTGTIISQENSGISVQFDDDEKRFAYPDAFRQFLTTQDAELQQQVQHDMREKQEQEDKRKVIWAVDTAVHIPSKTKGKVKKVERANIAFKCNYCDGGATPDSIGFNGICSDESIKYNIEKAKHVWCSNPDGACRQYRDRKISRNELCDRLKDGGSVCYESTMLRDWKASAGLVQAGIDRGKPMRLLKVQANSLAILTTREPYDTDDKRFIFAVFLVDESFEGDARDEGYVTTNSNWKIALTPHEAHKMLFWNYYANENAPENIKFGSGLHRYISDEQAVQILKDIIEIKKEPSEKRFAQEFLQHFCTINGIAANDVPSPNGALLRSN